jgi:hypothetical protein
MIDLSAIRARANNGFLDGCHREDRDALLRYVDELLALLHRTEDEKMALRAAAGKVTCRRCNGHGDLLQPDTVPPGWRTDPCPDCGPLRALLAKEGEPNE